MKRLSGCAAVFAAAALCACTPSEPPMATSPAANPARAEAPAPAAATPPAAAISLAGKWAGTITCYKIESPFQMTIDGAKSTEATLSKGEGGALSWPATVAINEATRAVTITSAGPADGAERVEGLLSADGALITGTMDKQLCTGFSLKRAS
ncbi:MAG TPA: hypothetical protein VGO52_11265 [Hyphomonadaceae bacterium]|nr:hypothetical protein [Hyphomonadaceae bacterium]